MLLLFKGLLDTYTFHDLKTVYKEFEVAVETENWSKSLQMAFLAQQIIFHASININEYNVLAKKPAVQNGKLNRRQFLKYIR